MPYKAHGTKIHCRETFPRMSYVVRKLSRSTGINHILAMMHSVRWPTSDMHPIEVGLDLGDAAAGRHGRRKGDNGSRNACMHAFTDMASLIVQTCIFFKQLTVEFVR